jgi:L-asparaginase
MTIINTGGTLNKRYNKIDGSLYVPKDNIAIEKISKNYIENKKIIGAIYKDSLDIDNNDREKLVQTINIIKDTKILIIQGTDTIDKTPLYINKYIKNKTILITGAMKPYEIEPFEASENISMGYGFLISQENKGVFICMSGLILPFDKIKKDKIQGVFKAL